ncbi:bifunctional ADP-dependent NAD(P)H-hydrate dehydratase/NAD(P)H-hydrate epimerase [Bryobacter aggregatus]|uniref:bifunctional ADP-dependent NAD(P)H-hydrate dehydratase/NAD(P)H-hydrate epimerase n=1 Tax=Bryobacter aggregatus TaxID=360054 RepID=UPI0004E14AFC|nr:bifunctional ADP-dependent NAD(P)H-hydrate dehydratase/NAD(P)H-hydrate epimerase [Bryobacter aggregatus]
MKILSPEEMRAADAAAVKAGIPAVILMENAAYGVLRELERRYAPLEKQRIAIFCGKGNNGGDGLALARLLHVHHRPAWLKVILAFDVEDMTESATGQLKMLEALGIPYTMQIPLDLAVTTLAIDALLGTGASGAPREPIASLVAQINALPIATRVAVDIPSGAVQADLTVSFEAPKLLQVLQPMGELVVVPIGLPVLHSQLQLTTRADLQPVGAPRAAASYKNSFGHVAILGGASGKHGALNLAGTTAIRAGAGLVTLYSPDAGFVPLLPDLMMGRWQDIPKTLQGKSVLAIGPGLGEDADKKKLVADLYLHWPAPLVLDADALNLLSPLTEAASFPRVLTPHPGEMKRLLGRDIVDRIEDARELAKRSHCIVVLKGDRTVIAFPDGETWINPTGSPALAKAGSGDVLTGLTAALLSQYRDHTKTAVIAAVYLHGRCGELAAQHQHEMTSLASTLCEYLPEALHELSYP